VKIGTVAYATTQGLGILAKGFFDHGIVTDVLVVEHSSRPTERDWYPDAPTTPSRPFNAGLARDFAAGMDAMLFFETPFDWELLPFCRSKGIPTTMMPMYECMPRELPRCPDEFICPSALDGLYYPGHPVLPVPVEVEWKQRNTAHTFIHNAGRLGLQGRNGTLELLQAMQFVDSPVRLIVRAQDSAVSKVLKRVPQIENDNRVTIEIGTIPPAELWETGDVFVFPEKFNGLSLPLQESRASGMLVMATDRFPMNTWLPRSPLIPVEKYIRSCVSPRCLPFDAAVVEPRAIAAAIDAWYGRDIRDYSRAGFQWAKNMSWDALKPRYMEHLAA